MATPKTADLVQYTANPSAVPFHQSPARVKALMGPVGSGKSLAWMFEIVALAALQKTALRSIVIRQSWPELRDSTKVTWDSKLGGISEWRQIDHQMRFTLRGVDGVTRTHLLDFRHARTAADATRLLSTEYGVIVLEECVPAFDVGRSVIGGGIAKEIFDVAVLRLRQPNVTRHELLCIFNPPPKTHWTYKEFIGPAETAEGRAKLEKRSSAVFTQPPFENTKNLPVGYYEHLLEMLSPELAQRFVYGKPITVYPGMPVYPEVLEDFHIVDRLDLVDGLGVITMHDFGRTPATVIAQVTPEGQFRAVQEIQLWGASTTKMAERLHHTLRNDFADFPWLRGWGDPAGQNPTETDDRTSFMIMAARGYPLLPGAETLAARKEAVKLRAARLVGREPALIVSSAGCPLLADALLGGYRYPRAGDGSIGFAPLKNDYSHIANALEYGITGEFSFLTGDAQQEHKKRLPGQLIPPLSPLSSPRARGGGGWMSR